MRLRWYPGPLLFELQPGDRLMDVLDDQPTSTLPMACRAANCGTCRVRIMSGANLIMAPDEWELSVLARYEAAPDERLGCQLRFTDDTRAAVDTRDAEAQVERVP